jgi:oligoribonuclease NrnB/cAMP/cGMP phosphodiesterase (DHH superfamily)
MVQLADPKTVDLVLAHGGCFDGFTSLWVAQLARGDAAEYHEVFFNQPPPDVTGRNVAIIDFAYDRETLEEMAEKAASIIVLDHHETNKKRLDGLPYAIFDMKRSGARLAYDWFESLLPDEMVGAADFLTGFVQDRDLWQWKLQDSREVTAAMMTLEFDFEEWSSFANGLYNDGSTYDDIVTRGRALRKLMARHVRQLAESARIGLVDQQPAWIANAPYIYASDLGEFLSGEPGPGVAAIWRYNHEKRELNVSLRASKESNVNVALIAEARGGGGHARAAGFEMNVPPGTLPFFGELPDDHPFV